MIPLIKKFCVLCPLFLAACTSTSLRDVPDLSKTEIRGYDLARIPEQTISLQIFDHRPPSHRANTEALVGLLTVRTTNILERSHITVKDGAPSSLRLSVSGETLEGSAIASKHDDCVELNGEVSLRRPESPHKTYDIKIKSLSCFSLNISKAYASALDQFFLTLEKKLAELPLQARL